jgi:hypothetical protein
VKRARGRKGGTYVVPVTGALLQSRTLEAESAQPATGLLGILGERKLACVVIPGAEQMHSLAVGRGAEREVELDNGHFERVIVSRGV